MTMELVASEVTFGGFVWTADFTTIDLIAASTNALMALLGGIGGGITRNVLVNEVPAAITNPAYITLCLGAGVVGYFLAFVVGFTFRVVALYRGWEEPLAKEPAGVYQHSGEPAMTHAGRVRIGGGR